MVSSKAMLERLFEFMPESGLMENWWQFVFNGFVQVPKEQKSKEAKAIAAANSSKGKKKVNKGICAALEALIAASQHF